MDDEIKRLNKKNFELARALAAAQRQISEKEALIEEHRQRHKQWVTQAQENLAELATAWIDAQEAWAWHKAS